MDSASDLYRGWKPFPNAGRSTLGLLYSCGLTIFICCWSSLHMNVPGDAESKVTRFGRQVKWMLICIVIPEYLAWNAAEEFWHARILRTEFVNIPQLRGWSLAHGFLLKMGGISLKTAQGRHFRPSVQHFLDLVADGQVEVTDISEEDIEDKSKASGIVKALSLVQILWFALGVLGRGIQRLPITTLELFTIAIIFCSILTYAFWWHKPRDIQRPFVLNLDTTVCLGDLKAKTKSNNYKRFQAPGERISFTDNNETDSIASIPTLILWGAILTVVSSFGPWHLLGWNFYFNTPAEQFLWRFSSIGCTVLPVLLVLIISPMRRTLGPASRIVLGWLMLVVICLYVLIRLYLLGECLANLRAVPVGVYENVRWLDIIPHIGS
jgi:hypothetical protein